jgi:hypothetical protein
MLAKIRAVAAVYLTLITFSACTKSRDASPRIGVGLSRLGTSEAVAIGAYAFALRKLDSIGDGLPTGR